MSVRASVIVATRNRGESVVRLARQLAAQDLPAGALEIIVVDDGSPEPVAPRLEGLGIDSMLRTVRIDWSGQGAARHCGASLARGEILVFLDDDMQVGPEFLQAHLDEHETTPRAVVLGNIQSDPALARMPLFERYHARQLARWRRAVASGTSAVKGQHLCTGNVSMRRADYFAVGGFDASLERSEDRELGIRLERHGCVMRFGAAAISVHSSDHAELGVWLRRAYLYGRVDLRIARRHPGTDAHPWRFWPLIHPLARPMVAIALGWPALARPLARLAYFAALLFDAVRLRGLAVTLTALTYALEYFRGMREECGSFAALRRDMRAARPERRAAAGAGRDFLRAVRADYESVRRNRMKYHGEEISPRRLSLDLFRKIGFQIMVCYRVMRLFDAARVPLVPMLLSRAIRHLYGAEIHWKAQMAPGVSLIHGVGLVISHAAVVGPGCILFQNVTLGEGRDAQTGAVGGPVLGANVHVGPGAMVIGPVGVGEGSKIAAGAVLTCSVEEDSLVMPAPPVITSRQRKGARPHAA